ncbi:hypothetical protein N431DRAFT_468741 [Stipitochalara longipes BDJ]|nr:hypothetical protein N431DRAFT_468741 [Stipitochalara longipes BDJ]
MSASCVFSKFARTSVSLATSSVVQPIPARSSNPHFRSRIPVRSQHFVSSVSTVAVPAQSATPSVSRRPLVPTTVPASSMPKKTEDSIQKHVERLRKTRAATTTYKTAPTFSKSKPAVLPPARSRPVPASAPVPRPVPASSPCIVSTLSALSLSASRTERPINNIERRAAPALRSCLKSSRTKRAPRSVRFIKYGAYNIHRIVAFEPDSAPTSFLALKDADIIPPIDARTTGPMHIYENTYRLLLPDRQLRLPPPDHDGPVRTGSTDPPRCRPCARVAGRGTRLFRTRPGMQSVWCTGCISDPDKRCYYVPALVDKGEDDHLDYCKHHKTVSTGIVSIKSTTDPKSRF